MKQMLLCIIIVLTVSFCAFPLQMNFLYVGTAHTMTDTSQGTDDDAFTKNENISINYARKDKRVKIDKYVRITERATAEKAIEYFDLGFNDTGLHTESIKRDYSGDDPINI